MIRLADEQRLREGIEQLEQAHEQLHRTTWRNRIIFGIAIAVMAVAGLALLLSYP